MVFILSNNGSKAVVPGFLLGYRGDAMMPEYSRYMATLPFFLAANSVSVAASAYALLVGGNHSFFMAFAIFMAIFSAKMFTQRLVRVSFNNELGPATSAALSVRVNTLLTAVSLGMMGVKSLELTGEFDTFFFESFGIMMIGVAAACLVALRRNGASTR